jgi:hypothetical protein
LEAFDPHADYSKSPTTAEDEDVAPAEPWSSFCNN